MLYVVGECMWNVACVCDIACIKNHQNSPRHSTHFSSTVYMAPFFSALFWALNALFCVFFLIGLCFFVC